jgi:hypothetical protein
VGWDINYCHFDSAQTVWVLTIEDEVKITGSPHAISAATGFSQHFPQVRNAGVGKLDNHSSAVMLRFKAAVSSYRRLKFRNCLEFAGLDYG